MSIGNRDERQFYEIEAQQSKWSLSELKRQFNTGLYERLALSRDKSGVRALARTGHVIEKPQDMLKDPYVLEFLGLEEKARYSESDLESAIIDKLEMFLLELGQRFPLRGTTEAAYLRYRPLLCRPCLLQPYSPVLRPDRS